MKYTLIFYLITIIFLINCSKNKIPATTEWVGITIKKELIIEKVIRTAGKGQAEIRWWAGGYTYENGKFSIELIDIKKEKTIFKKVYKYGDTKTGNTDNTRFNWWHSEESNKIILQANHTYKMKLWGTNLAEPGAGWGLWLFRFGEKSHKYSTSSQ